MFLADGGGGSSGTETPSYSGTKVLRIEPGAIPDALVAFRDAHKRITDQVNALSGIPVQAWAGDPVSHETQTPFHQRTNGGGGDSAIAVLKGYQNQLQGAITALEQAQAGYQATESGNAHSFHQA